MIIPQVLEEGWLGMDDSCGFFSKGCEPSSYTLHDAAELLLRGHS